MHLQKIEQLLFGGVVVGKAIGVAKDAAADHEAVYLWELLVEGEGVGAVFDVAINDELGGGRLVGSQIENFGDELVVRGDFAHLFASAEVDGESGGVLAKERGQPISKFLDVGPAEAGLDGDWERGGTAGVVEAFDGELGGLDHGGATAGAVDVFVGATEIKVDTGKAERGQCGTGFGEVGGLFAPDLCDDRCVAFCDCESL